MCGIAGWAGEVVWDKNMLADKMIQSMFHRGPDQQNKRHFEQVSLVHNRLKIIDLSDEASQPMCNEDESIWIIFNGEIYNFIELRKKLVSAGHRFKSKSDTEVLIHLYESYGNKMFDQLEGMFAFCIYDTKKNTLLLARDRFGIKPLFLYQSENFIAFASELNTLKQIPDIDLSISRQAISDYVSFLYVPSPLTFYSTIVSVEPGQYFEISLKWKHLFSDQKQVP